MELISATKKEFMVVQLMAGFEPHQYLNWMVALDRSIIQGHRGVEIHGCSCSMRFTRSQMEVMAKGVYDGRSKGQSVLVAGSARMDTFRQSGESLAGRYFAYRLHPVSVKEWWPTVGRHPSKPGSTDGARRIPEPCLARSVMADRWRRQYATI